MLNLISSLALARKTLKNLKQLAFADKFTSSIYIHLYHLATYHQSPRSCSDLSRFQSCKPNVILSQQLWLFWGSDRREGDRKPKIPADSAVYPWSGCKAYSVFFALVSLGTYLIPWQKSTQTAHTTDKVWVQSTRSFTSAVLLRNSLAKKQFELI